MSREPKIDITINPAEVVALSERCPHDPRRSKYDCCACALEEAERRIALTAKVRP